MSNGRIQIPGMAKGWYLRIGGVIFERDEREPFWWVCGLEVDNPRRGLSGTAKGETMRDAFDTVVLHLTRFAKWKPSQQALDNLWFAVAGDITVKRYYDPRQEVVNSPDDEATQHDHDPKD